MSARNGLLPWTIVLLLLSGACYALDVAPSAADGLKIEASCEKKEVGIGENLTATITLSATGAFTDEEINWCKDKLAKLASKGFEERNQAQEQLVRKFKKAGTCAWSPWLDKQQNQMRDAEQITRMKAIQKVISLLPPPEKDGGVRLVRDIQDFVDIGDIRVEMQRRCNSEWVTTGSPCLDGYFPTVPDSIVLERGKPKSIARHVNTRRPPGRYRVRFSYRYPLQPTEGEAAENGCYNGELTTDWVGFEIKDVPPNDCKILVKGLPKNWSIIHLYVGQVCEPPGWSPAKGGVKVETFEIVSLDSWNLNKKRPDEFAESFYIILCSKDYMGEIIDKDAHCEFLGESAEGKWFGQACSPDGLKVLHGLSKYLGGVDKDATRREAPNPEALENR